MRTTRRNAIPIHRRATGRGQTHWEISLFKRDGRVATREPFVRDKAPGYASLARSRVEEEIHAGRMLRAVRETRDQARKGERHAPCKCNVSHRTNGESISRVVLHFRSASGDPPEASTADIRIYDHIGTRPPQVLSTRIPSHRNGISLGVAGENEQ
ncbi:hypothetical protein DMN91_000674 [Ooceraea biroi]|uniref:Uncharacterized protein n=1 Tax=Ooceraea biroi TaxID=2015173 RepID=A0A3L8E2L7_OOCBI|nr:hypothetical protein DMN91_000674 [Ooceraea biroi]